MRCRAPLNPLLSLAPTARRVALVLSLLFGAALPAHADDSFDARIDRRLLRAAAAIGGAVDRPVARSRTDACRDAVGRPLCRIEFASEEAAARFAGSIRPVDADLAIEETRGSVLWAWATADGLRALGQARELVYACLPFTPLATAESEGLRDMRAKEFQSLGYRGRGVRVGVIDLGFQGYEPRLGGELPPSVHVRSFYGGARGDGDITGGGVEHGTACAEVIHDVAPEAELYLANVSNDLDLIRAVDWMTDEGVEVISHSLAWFVGGGDGQGPISEIVARAERHGIFWVTSAGNFANSHWGGGARDADQDGRLEFDAAGDETIGFGGLAQGNTIRFVLLWNRWPNSNDLAFAIDLRAADGTLLASSEEEFADFTYAFRELDYTVGPGGFAPALSIRRLRGAPGDVTLHLFRVDGGGTNALPEHAVLRGSLAIPADSPAALSVGAFGYRAQANAEPLEGFSSSGPTTDGRLKPELLAPDGVENSVYGRFTGTSAACPHVAGAVALLLSASIEGGLYDARLSPHAIRRLLENEALPLVAGKREPDAEGWGRVRLVLDRPSARARAARLIVIGSEAENLRLVLSATSPLPPTALRLFDLAGRRVALVTPSTVTARELSFKPGAVWRGTRGRYWALEPRSGASASFYWPGSP